MLPSTMLFKWKIHCYTDHFLLEFEEVEDSFQTIYSFLNLHMHPVEKKCAANLGWDLSLTGAGSEAPTWVLSVTGLVGSLGPLYREFVSSTGELKINNLF